MKKQVLIWLIWLFNLTWLMLVALLEAWLGPPLVSLVLLSWLARRSWRNWQAIIAWLILSVWLSGLYSLNLSLISLVLAVEIFLVSRWRRSSGLTWLFIAGVSAGLIWWKSLNAGYYYWWLAGSFVIWLMSVGLKNIRWQKQS